jgi:hypothetical protein
VLVDRSAEEVFDFLDDVRNEGRDPEVRERRLTVGDEDLPALTLGRRRALADAAGRGLAGL